MRAISQYWDAKKILPCFQKTNEQQGYNEACCEYGWRHIFCIWLCLQLSDFLEFSLVYLLKGQEWTKHEALEE